MKEKWKRFFVPLLVCLLLCAGTAGAESGSRSGSTGALRSSDGKSDVNVRTEPSMDAPLLGVYRSGVGADVIRREGDWLYIQIGGTGDGSYRGYVLEKYFSFSPEADCAQGLPVKQLSDAQAAWAIASQPWDLEETAASRREDGSLALGSSGWPKLAAGVRCVALGEVEDGEWTHVRIGLERYGFIRTQALEETGAVTLSSARLPRVGLAAVHPGTPYAMPVYAYTDDSTAQWATLREGDVVEYIACVGDWVQIAVANLLECAFVPAEYVTLYPYEALFAATDSYGDGVHRIETPGLYTFSCVGNGRMEICCDAYTRVYEGGGMYSMYLPRGAQVTVTDGMLAPVSTDACLEDLSENGIGAWDEVRGSGRYLGGIQMAADIWRSEMYIVTAADEKPCGYYRIETLDQDAGNAAQSEWIEIGADDVIELNLYHGQFIELKDAKLSYFSGNG